MDNPFDLSNINFGEIMGMAQQMKQRIEKMQADLAYLQVEASAGGGFVTVKANGLLQVLEVRIEQELLDMNDKQMLEDLIAAAVNEALARAKEQAQGEMQKITGGIPIPGGLSLL